MIKYYFIKIRYMLKSKGFIVLVYKIALNILAQIFSLNKMIIFELDLNRPIKMIDPKIDITYRMATEEDIDLMEKQDLDYDKKGKRYSKRRLDKGDKCILAVHNNAIVGYIWIMKDKMELSQYNHIVISNKRVYIYKGFVKAAIRGNRVFNGIDNYIIKMSKENKKELIITTVSTDNKESIKARERIGFIRIGKIIQVRLLGFKLDYIKKKMIHYLQVS